MADTAFERYLKDQADQGNIVKQEGTINNLDELRQSIQDLVIDTTEPKKPVKYFAESADPGAVLNLYYTLNPTRRLGQTIFTGEDPKESIKNIIKGCVVLVLLVGAGYLGFVSTLNFGSFGPSSNHCCF